VLLLASPTPVISSDLRASAGAATIAVTDSTEDAAHHFHTLTWMADRALQSSTATGSASPILAFLSWTGLLLQSHPSAHPRTGARR
jgi:hypothetical protein